MSQGTILIIGGGGKTGARAYVTYQPDLAVEGRESCVTAKSRRRSICTRRKTAMKHGQHRANS